jgi:hypothetical protein
MSTSPWTYSTRSERVRSSAPSPTPALVPTAVHNAPVLRGALLTAVDQARAAYREALAVAAEREETWRHLLNVRKRGILVGRPFPPMLNHLRVSVGTPEARLGHATHSPPSTESTRMRTGKRWARSARRVWNDTTTSNRPPARRHAQQRPAERRRWLPSGCRRAAPLTFRCRGRRCRSRRT